ncbi:DUF2828 family protein [Mycobacteroides abscessus]|uniref:DUF2828 family protein n=1 Tax=Mycobacteroides abscessus TaxID=36809 RepID=UPI0009A722FA|nr:DUF2828 family protein [Mycobacteroides abscessus]SKS42700.1 Domain of uncharacterised function (DUF2828) [Mycobacteroides abscessus subsp. bolletii]
MSTFIQELQRSNNFGRTANGAVTNTSSLDPVVDFFSTAGAMRGKEKQAAQLFEKAFRFDRQTAIRTLFYLRDVRGGQGERSVFRECYRTLAIMDAALAEKLLVHVPEYGRWDDIFYDGANVTDGMAYLIANQLEQDAVNANAGQAVSLLAKWLPSDSVKSAQRRKLQISLRKRLGLDQRTYRKLLSALRDRLGLLETDMSAKNWDKIDFSKLPGQAHRRHVKAFWRNTDGRYAKYLESLERGEAKANTSTLYPYELYEMAHRHGEASAANALWKNLPDYTRGDEAIVMADVSGSMRGRPMSVSVSLALYFAERNTGPYNGYFMTFSEKPELVTVTGANLHDKLRNIERSSWGYNTNIVAALDAILQAGVRSGSVPKTLYIVSDMEFDQASPLQRGHGWTTIFQAAKAEFARHGWNLPHIVFWNVNGRIGNQPALAHDGYVTLVSGFSPTTFSQAVEGKTPRELVDSVVNGPRYERIVL